MQGLVLEVRVHSAQIQDREGIKLLLDSAARDRLYERLAHLWLDAGYTGQDKGAGWVERVLGWTAEIVRHPPKLAPEEVMMRWAKEWAKEGVAIDTRKFMSHKSPRSFLPKRWIVKRTFSWLEQEDEQGLREAARELGSLHLRGYQPPDGEAIGPLMRLFGQFPNGILGSSLSSGAARMRLRIRHGVHKLAAHDL